MATGSSLLTTSLNKNNTIPLGTFITWFGLISLPLSIFLGIEQFRKPTKTFNNYLSKSLKVVLIIAAFWAVLSYFLAGNLSFSFSEKESFQGGQLAMKWFWRITYGIPIASIILLISYWLSLALSKK